MKYLIIFLIFFGIFYVVRGQEQRILYHNTRSTKTETTNTIKKSGFVKGTVTENTTNKGIKAAKVCLLTYDDDTLATTFTNEKGEFQLDNLEISNAKLSCEATGYVTFSTPLLAIEKHFTQFKITLLPKAANGGIDSDNSLN
jgi:preprotein translocase subunit YajC